MYTQWMVIKGMVFVLVTLNHFSSCSRTSSNSMTQVDTSSLNEGVGRKEHFFSLSEKEGEKKKRNEEENFTESMTPLNQLRMNEEQVCSFLHLPTSLFFLSLSFLFFCSFSLLYLSFFLFLTFSLSLSLFVFLFPSLSFSLSIRKSSCVCSVFFQNQRTFIHFLSCPPGWNGKRVSRKKSQKNREKKTEGEKKKEWEERILGILNFLLCN